MLTTEQTTSLLSTSACYTTAWFHSAGPFPTANSVIPPQSRGNHRLSYKAGSGFTRLFVVSTTLWLSYPFIWKERKQTSLRVPGYFAQTTHLHRWQQTAARIEAGHDYSHTSLSYPSREPHWSNPEGQDWWKTCGSTHGNQIIIQVTLAHTAKCTVIARTEWYYSIAHGRRHP